MCAKEDDTTKITTTDTIKTYDQVISTKTPPKFIYFSLYSCSSCSFSLSIKSLAS